MSIDLAFYGVDTVRAEAVVHRGSGWLRLTVKTDGGESRLDIFGPSEAQIRAWAEAINSASFWPTARVLQAAE